MALVLHLSADYPDTIQPVKTRAIAALVDATRGPLRHRVYSLNRAMNGTALIRPGTLAIADDDGEVASCCYAAPPGALFLRRAMHRVAREVAADLARQGLQPDVVHGHKLSFEGLAAEELARLLGRPYVLTLQGNTDQKLIRLRPDLRPAWRRCWHGAAQVFAFAPWTADWCAAALGARSQPARALPCILASDALLAPTETGPLVRTAFHLDHWRNKNIAGLAKACATLVPRFPELRLEIAGGGSPAAEQSIDRILAEAGLAARARRVGPVDPAAIQAWMNGAAVFALPSRRESFGMVFVEALLAGCPIVHPAGAAVDGYFTGQPFALAADAADPSAIAVAIGAQLADNAECKRKLSAWQGSADATRFTRTAIAASYAGAVAEALA